MLGKSGIRGIVQFTEGIERVLQIKSCWITNKNKGF